KYRYGQWGEPLEACISDTGAEPLSARYDLILGSDLLYDRDAPKALADFIDDHGVFCRGVDHRPGSRPSPCFRPRDGVLWIRARGTGAHRRARGRGRRTLQRPAAEIQPRVIAAGAPGRLPGRRLAGA